MDGEEVITASYLQGMVFDNDHGLVLSSDIIIIIMPLAAGPYFRRSQKRFSSPALSLLLTLFLLSLFHLSLFFHSSARCVHISFRSTGFGGMRACGDCYIWEFI